MTVTSSNTILGKQCVNVKIIEKLLNSVKYSLDYLKCL